MTQGPRPVLVVFSGLPGTGKTTVARALSRRLGAVYLRIDVIEQAMMAAGAQAIGPSGYAVANALAESNLLLGQSVIADCVNPVRESRQGWRSVARDASVRMVDIYLVCSDVDEHRRRVEQRIADVPGLVLPNWDDVLRHNFESRDGEHLLLDTAVLSVADLCDRIAVYMLECGEADGPGQEFVLNCG